MAEPQQVAGRNRLPGCPLTAGYQPPRAPVPERLIGRLLYSLVILRVLCGLFQHAINIIGFCISNRNRRVGSGVFSFGTESANSTSKRSCSLSAARSSHSCKYLPLRQKQAPKTYPVPSAGNARSIFATSQRKESFYISWSRINNPKLLKCFPCSILLNS